jgi:hypothetical protein
MSNSSARYIPGFELNTLGGFTPKSYAANQFPFIAKVNLHGKDMSYSIDGVHMQNLGRSNIVVALCEPDDQTKLGQDPLFSSEKIIDVVPLGNGESSFKPLPPARYMVTVSQKYVGTQGYGSSLTAAGVELSEVLGTTITILPGSDQGKVKLIIGAADSKKNCVTFINKTRYDHVCKISRPALSLAESLVLLNEKRHCVGSNPPDCGGPVVESVTVAAFSTEYSSIIHQYYDLFALETEEQLDSGNVGNVYVNITGRIVNKQRFVQRAHTKL